MISGVWTSFVQEMVKLSEQSKAQRQQRLMMRDFAILGATTTPLVSGLLNTIEKGEFAPPKGNPFRWMAKNVAAGLLGGALFPTIRRKLTGPLPKDRRKSTTAS